VKYFHYEVLAAPSRVARVVDYVIFRYSRRRFAIKYCGTQKHDRTAAMATHACDQMDRVRTERNAVFK